MLRSQLIDALQARLRDVPTQDVGLAVAPLLDGIAAMLARGGRVEIRGFGSLTTHTVPARTSRNPKTGAPVAVPRSRRVVFRPGQVLRASVAGDSGAR